MDGRSPRPPAIPAPEITDFQTVEQDGASVQYVTFYNHTGTHLDTEAHVFSTGISIEAFAPEDLIFRNVVILSFDRQNKYHMIAADLEPYVDILTTCDMAIVRFGVDGIRRNDHNRFSNMMPGFTCEAATWLREHCLKLRCLGTDLPSFAVISDLDNTMHAHNVFLEGSAKKMLIIEEMNLGALPEKIAEIIISPWLFTGMNSGPCTVWARYI